jgi:hypothetical protein
MRRAVKLCEYFRLHPLRAPASVGTGEPLRMSPQCVGGTAHRTTSEQYKSGCPSGQHDSSVSNMIGTPLHRLPDRRPAICCSVAPGAALYYLDRTEEDFSSRSSSLGSAQLAGELSDRVVYSPLSDAARHRYPEVRHHQLRLPAIDLLFVPSDWAKIPTARSRDLRSIAAMSWRSLLCPKRAARPAALLD